MATQRQTAAIKKVVENGGNVSKAMRDVGYSAKTAKTPGKLTGSKSWEELMKRELPDKAVIQVHKQLLNAHKMDHMIFPLGPKDDQEINLSGGKVLSESDDDEDDEEEDESKDRTTMTDKEIVFMLATVNCTVRRIVHGESCRHVYFWSPDNKAKKEAVDLAYKLKGKYAAEKHDHKVKGSVIYLPPKKK